MANNRQYRQVVNLSSQKYTRFKIDSESYNFNNPNKGRPLGDTPVQVYVNASVINYQAGCGLYIFDHLQSKSICQDFFLWPQGSDVFCETIAIYLASEWLINNPTITSGSEVAIYTGSKNSIKDVATMFMSRDYDPKQVCVAQSYNALLTATLTSLLKASRHYHFLTLRWVEAGHRGNKISDWLAKEGALGTKPPFNAYEKIIFTANPLQLYRSNYALCQYYQRLTIDSNSYDFYNINKGKPIGDTSMQVYVDASVLMHDNNHAGCGLYVCDFPQNKFDHRQGFYLGQQWSQWSVVFCEAMALYYSSQWLINNAAITSESEVAIYSDSLSCIKALKSIFNSRDSCAQTLKNKPQIYISLLRETISCLSIASLSCHRLTLRWVKAHDGHNGNTIADSLAKEAATGKKAFCRSEEIPKNNQPPIHSNRMIDGAKKVFHTG